MQVSNYLVVKKTGNWRKMYTTRLTVDSPNLQSNEVAVKIVLSIPDAVFEKPAFEAKMVIPEEAVNQTVISAEIIDNVQEIIKQNTGFDVKLQIVEPDKEEV